MDDARPYGYAFFNGFFRLDRIFRADAAGNCGVGRQNLGAIRAECRESFLNPSDYRDDTGVLALIALR